MRNLKDIWIYLYLKENDTSVSNGADNFLKQVANELRKEDYNVSFKRGYVELTLNEYYGTISCILNQQAPERFDETTILILKNDFKCFKKSPKALAEYILSQIKEKGW